MIYPEHRADGWPLCPQCREDELYSLFPWDGSDPKPPMQAWIDHGLRCYRCGFDSDHRTLHVTMAAAPPDRSLYVQCDPDEAAYYERQAIMRAVCDSLALMNVPPPVAPVVQPNRYTLRYGVMICQTCGLAKEFCRGHAPPAATAAQDGAESSLERRARECMGGK